MTTFDNTVNAHPALDALAKGYAVILLRRPGEPIKKGSSKLTKGKEPTGGNWQDNPCTDAAVLAKHVRYGIIAARSGPNGVVIMDYDVKRTGSLEASVQAVADASGEAFDDLMSAVTTLTPSGGGHAPYQCPPGVRIETLKECLGGTFDTRAGWIDENGKVVSAGQVVGPGSVLHPGQVYTGSLPPADRLPMLPAKLEAFLRGLSTPATPVPKQPKKPASASRKPSKRTKNAMGALPYDEAAEVEIFREALPYVVNSEKFSVSSRIGNLRMGFVLHAMVRQGMSEATARDLYHEYASYDPNYGVVWVDAGGVQHDYTEAANDATFDEARTWDDKGGSTNRDDITFGSVRRVAEETAGALVNSGQMDPNDVPPRLLPGYKRAPKAATLQAPQITEDSEYDPNDDDTSTSPQPAPLAQPPEQPGDCQSQTEHAPSAFDPRTLPPLPEKFYYNPMAGHDIFARVSKSDGEDEDGNQIFIHRNVFVCSLAYPLIRSRDVDNLRWGTHWCVHTEDGVINEVRVDHGDLAVKSGEHVRAMFMEAGARLSPDNESKRLFLELLHTAVPNERWRFADKLGWHGKTFVLPDEAIGTSGEPFKMSIRNERFNIAGTLAEWQNEVALPCMQSTRMVFAIGAALSAPLLGVLGASGVIFNLYGRSSTGKTTALDVASSVWGGGRVGYKRSWRTTDNALEATCREHNDALLCLDEMNQAVRAKGGAQALGECAYMIANGVGKSRMTQTAEARAVATWRVVGLSSGEKTLADFLSSDDRERQAGQAVRCIDIPSDAEKGYGIFDGVPSELAHLTHAAAGAALSQRLKAASAKHYGHVAREFLRRLVLSYDALQPKLSAKAETLTRMWAHGADGQVERVAHSFAIVAVAGRLAELTGLLPWPVGTTERAVKELFDEWLAARGGAANQSQEQIDAVKNWGNFVNEHASTSFDDLVGGKVVQNNAVRTRHGVTEPILDANKQQIGRRYYVFPKSLKTICRVSGKDAAEALHAAGLLKSSGKDMAQKPRVQGLPRQRLYVLEMMG